LPRYPVKFKPIFKERIWGSDRLKTLFGKDLPADTKIGESWELADLPDDCSQIADGPRKGMNLRQLLEEIGQPFGFTDQQRRFPFGLLIKFLDANDVLSVQVHPDADACKLVPEARLKTECWYVLAAENGSVIYRGLKPGIGREQVENAVKDGILQDLMVVYPANTGDFHYLPAGTIHALGAGVVVAEIQTPSDTTYRLYDWNRLDAQGCSRELHIEQALSSIHYTDEIQADKAPHPPIEPTTPPPTAFAAEFDSKISNLDILLNCPFFSVGVLNNKDRIQAGFELSQPMVLISLSCTGSVTNQKAADYTCHFQPGDTILMPKMTGSLEIIEPGQCLLTHLGAIVS
jgi:mannose-6-phosphate isomerase